ncbi:hypothetical protein V1519DRAFT_27999 [Lipomyces tetrasporus]
MQKVFHINVNAPTLLASKLLRATKKIVFVSSVAVSFDLRRTSARFSPSWSSIHLRRF